MKQQLADSPLTAVHILPRGAVMLPCNAAAQVHSSSSVHFDAAASNAQLISHSVLITAACHVGSGCGAQLRDYERLKDAREWTAELEEHGMLGADTPVAFMLRRDDNQLQVAFLSQQHRDAVKTRLDVRAKKLEKEVAQAARVKEEAEQAARVKQEAEQ